MKVKRQTRGAVSAGKVKLAVRDLKTVAAIRHEVRDEILRRAVEVIGSEDAAMRWMGTPVGALDYATPVSMLHDENGIEAVRVVLGRLEHGVL